MSFIRSRTKVAFAIVAVAVLAPAAAWAAHDFADVPTDAFFHEPVEWALENEITVGCNGGTGFCPNDPVTRGENITFAQRYDTNVVQPALSAIEARLDALENAPMPFATVVDEVPGAVVVPSTDAVSTNSLSVTAPADGHVTVNSSAHTVDNDAGDFIRCSISDSTAFNLGHEQTWESAGEDGGWGQLAGTRSFEISAGETATYHLVCETSGGADDTVVRDVVLTAIYTPS